MYLCMHVHAHIQCTLQVDAVPGSEWWRVGFESIGLHEGGQLSRDLSQCLTSLCQERGVGQS